MRITLIDNYDSFTWNLVHLIGGCGGEVTVVRNDQTSVEAVMAEAPDAIVLSPGPRTPAEAGICCDLIRAASDSIPILGVCLGHQAIGEVFGGTVVRNAPMHGKVSTIHHGGKALFHGLNGDFSGTRYHSLVVDRATCPPELTITAETDDGAIMALSHRDRPAHGVQFHPESILSEQGEAIIRNFMRLAEDWNTKNRGAASAKSAVELKV